MSAIQASSAYIPVRRAGIGTSTIGFTTANNGVTDHDRGLTVQDPLGTDRSTRQTCHREACVKAYSFLRGLQEGRGVKIKLCSKAARGVIRLSVTGVYKIRIGARASLLDDACARERVLRRVGDRTGFRTLDNLTSDSYACGCNPPCWANCMVNSDVQP